MNFIKGIEIYIFPVNHITINQEPYVQHLEHLAHSVQQYLRPKDLNPSR